MSAKDGGPAFPVECSWAGGELSGKQTGSNVGWEMGMSLRDWFAGQALPALLTRSDFRSFQGAAHDAYVMADKMLAARKDGKP